MDDFGKPATSSGDSFKARDFLGKLVLFMGHEKRMVDTDNGEATVAECQLIAIPEAGEVLSDCWVFGMSLAPAIYKSPAPVVVGIIGQGEAKAGRSAPWQLHEASEEQTERARKWYTDNIVRSEAGQFFFKPDEAPF
jgi:hypothetical protein